MISYQQYTSLMQYIDDIATKMKPLTVKQDVTDTEMILGSLACLQEETGELAAEIRKHLKMSFSQKKVDAFSFDDLTQEWVDVLIVLLLTLKACGVTDLSEAIQQKIAKNDQRGYR